MRACACACACVCVCVCVRARARVCVVADLEGDVLLHISVTMTAVIAVMGCVRLIDLTVSVCVVPCNCSKPEQPVITNSPRTVLAKT